MSKRPLISHSKISDGLDALSGIPSVRSRLLPDSWHHGQNPRKPVNLPVGKSLLPEPHSNVKTARSMSDLWQNTQGPLKTVHPSAPANPCTDLREKLKRKKQQHYRESSDERQMHDKHEIANSVRRSLSTRNPSQEHYPLIRTTPILRSRSEGSNRHYSPHRRASDHDDMANTRISPMRRTALLPSPSQNHVSLDRRVDFVDLEAPSSSSRAHNYLIPGLPVPKVKYLPGYSNSGREIQDEEVSYVKSVKRKQVTTENSQPAVNSRLQEIAGGVAQTENHRQVYDGSLIAENHDEAHQTVENSPSSFKMKLTKPTSSQPRVLENVDIECFNDIDGSHYQPEEAPPLQLYAPPPQSVLQLQHIPPPLPQHTQPAQSAHSFSNTGVYLDPITGAPWQCTGEQAHSSAMYPPTTMNPHLQYPQGVYLSPEQRDILLQQNLMLQQNHQLQSPQSVSQKVQPVETAPRPLKMNEPSTSNYIDEIQEPVDFKLFEGIINKTLDPSVLIRCIKALAEIRDTLPLPGQGMISVTDKMTYFMALNDVLRRLHRSYEEKRQYKETVVVKSNKSLPEITVCRSKTDFVRIKTLEILDFLNNSEDISKLNDIDLTYNDAMEGVPEGLDWVYSLNENDLYVDPNSVVPEPPPEQNEPVEDKVDEFEGLIEPDIDLVFDDS